jgi:queuine tRNA-ribosyltransferase
MFDFTITARNNLARTGIFTTPHGDLLTPVFAPVGTQATVKTLTPAQVRDLGATLVLAASHAHRLGRLPGLLAGADPSDR